MVVNLIQQQLQRFKRAHEKITCTNTFSSAETVKKILPKTELGVHKSICFKVLLLRLETKKHCLEGDKLGKVLICISYQFRRKNQSFLQNFTRLHLMTRTFYFRLIVCDRPHSPRQIPSTTISRTSVQIPPRRLQTTMPQSMLYQMNWCSPL